MPSTTLPDFEEKLSAALTSLDAKKEEEGGMLDTAGAVLSDIGTGITEAPGAILRGAGRAANETIETLDSAGDWLNENVGDLGTPELFNEAGEFSPRLRPSRPEDGFKAPFDVNGRASSVTGQMVEGVSQFATGMIGLGKVLKPFKGMAASTKVGKAAQEIAKAATVGAVAFDPHEERLSNLVQSFPALNNPVTRFLAADPTDGAAEGRFKSALESIGLDVGLGALLLASTKVLRAVRSGDTTAAKEAAVEAEEAFAEADPVDIGEDLFEAPPGAPEGSTLPVAANENGPVVTTANDNSTVKLAQGNGPPLDIPSGSGDLAALPAPLDPNQKPSLGPAANTNAPVGPVGATNDNVGAPVTVGDYFARATAPSGPRKIPITSRTAASADTAPGPEPDSLSVVGSREGLGGKAGKDGLPTPGTIPVSAEQGASIVGRIRRDVQSIVTFGSRENALEAGHRFGHEDTIPWQKLNAPDDLQAFIGNMAEELRADLDKVKGGAVLSDARLERLVGQRLALYGDDPTQARGTFQRAGKEAQSLAANMEAADAVAIKMSDEAYRVANKIRMGNLTEWGGSEAAAVAEFVKRAGLAMEVFGASRSMLSNAARTVRRARGDLPRLSFKEIQALKGMDAQTLLKVIQSTNGDVKALQQALSKPSLLSRIADTASFLMVNNLLWGWKTHVVNITTNAYMLGARPAERIIGSLGVSGGSQIRKQALREYRFMTATVADAFTMAAKAFVEGDSILIPHQTEIHSITDMAKSGSFRPTRSVRDLGHNSLVATMKALGLPTRALGTVDEMIKQVSYRSLVLAEGSMQADEMGLTGTAYRDFVSGYLDQAFDANGAGTNVRALREAKIATFSQELDPNGPSASIQNFVTKFPLFRLVVPFVRTPTNVLKYGIKLTPGLNGLQKEYRDAFRGKLGPEEQAQAFGQMAMGALFMGTAASLVAEGKFTGSGPKDPKIRSQLIAQGWQPFSVVLENEDKTKTYVPLGRFDPVAMPFGLIADIMDIMQHPEKAEGADGLIAALSIAVINQVSDKTYLMNINQFLDAITDPERNFTKFAARMGGNLVPFSSLLRQSNSDPYLREVREMTDGVLQTVPGLSDKLPIRYDAFGDPILVRRGLHTTDEADLVEREMERMGMETNTGISAPSPNYKGTDLRTIKLADGRTAYEVFQQYAGHPEGQPSLKKTLAKVIMSNAYQKAPDGTSDTKGTRQAILRDIVTKYRQGAMKRLMRESAEVREAAFQAELKVRGAYLDAKSKPKVDNPLESLAETYGLDLKALAQP